MLLVAELQDGKYGVGSERSQDFRFHLCFLFLSIPFFSSFFSAPVFSFFKKFKSIVSSKDVTYSLLIQVLTT